MTIGDRVKLLRTQKGMTQLELAEKLGYKSKSSVAHIENGRDIPRSMVAALADVLGTTPAYLMGWEENMPEKQRPPLTFVMSEEAKKNISSVFDQIVDLTIDKYLINNLKIDDKEFEMISKYRTLDGYGKKAVDSVLDVEYERCTAEPEQPTIEIQLCTLPVSAGTGEFLSDEMSKIITIPDTPLNRSADFIVEVSGDSMLPEYKNEDYLLVHKQETVEVGEIGIFVVNGCGYVKKFGGDRLISLNAKYPDIEYGEYDTVVCYGKVIGKVL